MTDQDKRTRLVLDMIPADWDQAPYQLALELRTLLDAVKDHGTNIDSGTGNGFADLHVMVGGVEYLISIKRS